MNNSYTFACGQGATKAMIHCIEDGTLLKEDCCIVNSTQKDIPYEYRNGSVSTIIITDSTSASFFFIEISSYKFCMCGTLSASLFLPLC